MMHQIDMKSEVSPSVDFWQVGVFVVAVFVFLFLRTFMLPGVPLVAWGDETMYFAHGIRVLHGQVPFRDYFTYVMPGADQFYASAFGLLGVHAWLTQAFVIGLGGSIACLLVWIARGVLRGTMMFLPGLLFLVLVFDTIKDATHHWYSTLLTLTAIAVLQGGRSLTRMVAAGTLCGLAALFTQSQGVMSLLAVSAYLAMTGEETTRNRVVQMAALVAPFAVLVGGVLGYYVYQVGFATVYYALVTFVLYFFPAMRAHSLGAYSLQIPPHHRIADVLRIVPYVFVHLFLPFGYLLGLWRLWQKREAVERKVWESMLLINLVGLGLFVAIASAPSYHRMSMVAAPATIVCVWLVSGSCKTDRTVRGLLWAGSVATIVLLPIQTQRHWRGILDLPTGRTAFLEREDYEEFRWFAEKTHAGESFFNEPQHSFVLGLENPTAVDYVTRTEYTTKEQVKAVIRALEAKQTPLIVYSSQMYAPSRDLYAPGRTGDNLGPFLEYVERNYHVVKVFPTMQVWERN
jgi:hypothetical protein